MDIKDIDLSSLGKERKFSHPDLVENTRYGGVSTQNNLVAFYANKSGPAYNEAMKVMTQLAIDQLVIDLQIMTKINLMILF